MLQIRNTLVSLDLAERFFCCDLAKCKGCCCIEGDAGAPITEEEEEEIKRLLPLIWDDLLPGAKRAIEEEGVSYRDVTGDLVTQIIENKNCVFTCYGEDGTCLCAFEKAYREGRIPFYKPISCHLYPVRLKEFPSFTAVNYDRWSICKCAEKKGKSLGLRLYKFLKEPLVRKFGQDWYDELCLTCEEYLKQYDSESEGEE